MPALLVLGLIFVVGLFIFYLMSTRSERSSDEEEKTREYDELKKEENVIFLPNDIESMKEKHRKK